MQTYETEEQQVEAMKQWWSANGRSVIGGLAIGIAVIVGWKAWTNQQTRHAGEASQLYDQLSANLADAGSSAGQNADQADKARQRASDFGDKLLSAYDDTAYASMADLALAKIAVNEGNLDDARLRLQRLSSGESAKAESLALNSIARVRLARLYISTGDYDKALNELNAKLADGFKAIAMEIRGDALQAKGDKAEAAKAYDEAMSMMDLAEQSQTTQRNLVQMKRDDLGA